MRQSYSLNSKRFNQSNQISKSFIQSYHNKRIYNESIQYQPINIFQQLQKRLTIIPPVNTSNIDLNISVTIYTQNIKREKQNMQYSKPHVKFNYLNAPIERVTQLENLTSKKFDVSVIDDLKGLVNDHKDEKMTQAIEKKSVSIQSEKLQSEKIAHSQQIEIYDSLEIKDHNSQDKKKIDFVKQNSIKDSHPQLKIEDQGLFISLQKPVYLNSATIIEKPYKQQYNIQNDILIENKQYQANQYDNHQRNNLQYIQKSDIKRIDSKEKSLIHILQNEESENQIIHLIPQETQINKDTQHKPKYNKFENTNQNNEHSQQGAKYSDSQSIINSKNQKSIDQQSIHTENILKLNQNSFRKRKKIFDHEQRKQIISKSNPPKQCIYKLSENIKYQYSKKMEKIKVPGFIMESWLQTK